MASRKAPFKQVALLIESSRAYGRGLIRGVAAYAREHGTWSVRHQEMSIDADPPPWLARWRGDGIIARIETPGMARTIEKLRVPTVDLRCLRPVSKTPGFDTDEASVARLAVDHLRDLGHSRFGFCGFAGANYSESRFSEMRAYLEALGYGVVSYESPGPEHWTTVAAEQSGMLDEKGLAQWLKSLDKPVGVLACNDVRAQQILNVCHQERIHVPDDIAVIGVDNDDVICPMCAPPLTSVEPDTRRIGYEAAALLDRMMAGRKAPPGVTRVPAKRLVARGSTDSIPVDDADFVKAYRFIRENASRGVSVDEVARAGMMSRRSLERRMRRYLDKAPSEVITAIRLARIKELLEATSFSLKRIARMTGFNSFELLAKFFRTHAGLPPGQYRTQNRLELKLDHGIDLEE